MKLYYWNARMWTGQRGRTQELCPVCELNQYALPSRLEKHLAQPGGSFSSLGSNGDCTGEGDSCGVDATDEVKWTIGGGDDDGDGNGKEWGTEDGIPIAIGTTSCKGLGFIIFSEESGSKIKGNSWMVGTKVGFG